MVSLKRLSVVAMSLFCLMGFAACGTNPSLNSTTSAVSYGYYAKSTTTAHSTTSMPSTKKQTQVTNPKMTKTTMQGSQHQNGIMATTNNQNTMPSNTNTQSSQMKPTDKNTYSGSAQGATMSNGNSQSSGNSSNASNGASQNGGNQGSTGSTGSTGSIYIRVAQASINGQTVQILTTGTGLTLYYRTSDVPPNNVCTGSCAQNWPPLLAQGQIITSMNITSGVLSIAQTANGSQVEYNGHPLYTYVGDTAAGQTNGQGVGNVWYTVSVTTQAFHW
jgi:predicted lipoprotein with Yx(FWY)xxD motif